MRTYISAQHACTIKSVCIACFLMDVQVVTIHVDIPTLERILIDAFDTIGYRIYDKTKDTNPYRD